MRLHHLFSRWLRREGRKTSPPLTRRPAPVAARLEELERRDVPATFANEAYVSTLYQGLLGRPADSAGLSFWSGQLNAGAPPVRVAQDILASDEYRGREVQMLYPTLLGRPADPQGLNTWLTVLQGGTTLERIKAGILGSDEFFARSGGTPQGFLTALYRDELGRDPDPAGLNTWETALRQGVPRTTVALLVSTSPEAERVQVGNVYQEILSRPADAGGLTFWSGLLQGEATEDTVIAGLAGSNEFFARMSASVAAGGPTHPNAAATQFLTSTNAFGASRPGVEQLNRNITTVPVVLPPVPVASSPTGAALLNEIQLADQIVFDLASQRALNSAFDPTLGTGFVPAFAPNFPYYGNVPPPPVREPFPGVVNPSAFGPGFNFGGSGLPGIYSYGPSFGGPVYSYFA